MRRAVTPLLLALAIVSTLVAQFVATSGPTTRYSRLYVFGDSYSDIGAGYIDGNGPAVAYLGWLMGLEVIEQGGQRGWQEPRVCRKRRGYR
jgi:hypothetical protein